MFVLFYFCVTSTSWLMLGSLATVTGCDENCGDFHRICPAVKNQTFYDDYSAKHSSGQLGIFSYSPLPPPPDCGTGFYQTACPRSCEICISCESVLLENARQTDSPSESGDLDETPAAQENNAVESQPETSPPESGDLDGTPAAEEHNAVEIEPEPVKLELSYDKNDNGSRGFLPLKNAVDGSTSSYYMSSSNNSPSVEFPFTKEYSVDKVVFTAATYNEEKAAKYDISICDDDSCTPCDPLNLVSKSTLTTLFATSCDNKRGTKIKVQEPENDYLIIVEFEVFRTED